MKKVICFVLTLFMFFSTVPGIAQSEISILIDGKEQRYDVMPLNISGRVFVPMRGIFEALGAEIVWRDDIRTVTASKDKKEVVVTIDSLNARIDGQPVKIDVAPIIVEGRTMEPVRFVSEAMGEDVAWDDATKTVIITHNKNSGLKRLVSDFHRPVPTEFEKSNALDDLIYIEGDSKKPEDMFSALPKNPTVMISLDDLEKGKMTSDKYATAEMTKSDSGEKVFKIDVFKSSDSSKNCIYKLEKSLEGMLNEGDSCLLKVTMRTTSGGDENGMGRIQVQAEHPTLFDKDIWEYVDAGREWTTTYYSYQPNLKKGPRCSIGFRVPFYVQTLEISEFSILNYGKTVDFADMPVMPVDYSKFGPDKEWRNKAIDDIEKYRKDDFNIVVLDKDGKPLKDAEVELDMFEHEFEFGSCFRTAIAGNEKYRQAASSLFNAGVDEGAMKWEPYENGGVESARKIADGIKELGIKYYRGHTLIWQVPVTSSGNRMVPEDVVKLANDGKTEALRKRANDHITRIMGDYIGELTEWDVVNETVGNKQLETNNGGMKLEKEWFELARKIEPGVDLFYNEATVYIERFDAQRTKEFFRILDEMKAMDIDYDGIGLQSHHDKAQENMEEILAVFDKVNSYGKEVKVTEYSCAVSDPVLQANFTRDFFISVFSKPYITGIIMWGFWDGSNFEPYSPVYDKEWNLKPAGKQIVDLLYNKWWTRDAKANTDSDGRATIRGFFGDYDVTVRHNGQEKKVMCSFGMGYDNTLYVTMD